MKILAIGDVIGSPGRNMVARHLPGLKSGMHIDVVSANVENLTAGFGVTNETLQELKDAGVDVFTSGNHIWDRKEVENSWAKFPTLIRPANYPLGVPGRGECIFATATGIQVGFSNVLGRIFFPQPIDDPFNAAYSSISRLKSQGAQVVVMDVHAEATSEKVAMGLHLDGQVSFVFGTHTHIPTADARILPKGTGYISDLGATGGYGGVIGMKPESVLKRFITGMPSRFEPTEENPEFWALLAEIDEKTGKCVKVEQIRR